MSTGIDLHVLDTPEAVAEEAAARIVRATRPKDPTAPEFIRKMVDWGAGPRAGQYLILGGKAFAAMDGRYSVSIDDIRRVAIPVLRHRLGLNFAAQAEGADAVEIVNRLLDAVPEPEVPKYERPAPEPPDLPHLELLEPGGGEPAQPA
jgi:MoxR-like ATPase